MRLQPCTAAAALPWAASTVLPPAKGSLCPLLVPVPPAAGPSSERPPPLRAPAHQSQLRGPFIPGRGRSQAHLTFHSSCGTALSLAPGAQLLLSRRHRATRHTRRPVTSEPPYVAPCLPRNPRLHPALTQRERPLAHTTLFPPDLLHISSACCLPFAAACSEC